MAPCTLWKLQPWPRLESPPTSNAAGSERPLGVQSADDSSSASSPRCLTYFEQSGLRPGETVVESSVLALRGPCFCLREMA
eukprot:6387535-Pyramimonas_sp.AAC.1